MQPTQPQSQSQSQSQSQPQPQPKSQLNNDSMITTPLLSVQVKPKLQVMFSNLNQIYQHPLHYTYILHQDDNYLYLYDEGTMDKVAKTKVQVKQHMRYFAMTHDFNVFYGMKEAHFIMKFQLNNVGTGAILHHSDITKQWSSYTKNKINNVTKMTYFADTDKIICVTNRKFLFVSPSNSNNFQNQPLIYTPTATQIFPEKIAQISPRKWIIGYNTAVYLLSFTQCFTKHQIHQQIKINEKISSLHTENDPKKQFSYVITQTNKVIVLHFDQHQLSICKRIHQPQQCKEIPLFLNFIRPGINTSTTNKLQSHVFLLLYCQSTVQTKQKIQESNQSKSQMINEQEQKQRQRQRQIKLQQQQKFKMMMDVECYYNNDNRQKIGPVTATKYHIRIFPTILTTKQCKINDQNVPPADQSSQIIPFLQDVEIKTKEQQKKSSSSSVVVKQPLKKNFTADASAKITTASTTTIKSDKPSFVIKNMPILKKAPWTSALQENKLFFLSEDKSVYFIDICQIKELGFNNANQWSNMGYKFEVLTKNQLYEQKQEQFQQVDDIQYQEKQLTFDFLNDWSDSLLPKVQKRIARLKNIV